MKTNSHQRFLPRFLTSLLLLSLVACSSATPSAVATPSQPAAAVPETALPATQTPGLPAVTLTSAQPTNTPGPSSTPIPARRLDTGSNVPEYLVLISIDGCRPEYLDLASMPNLKSLMANGAQYTGAWVGSLESNTPPDHVEMATGTFPKHNGMLGFSWTDSDTGKLINPTTLDAINRGEMAKIVADSDVPTLAGLVKGKYADAKVVVVSGQKFYAAQGLGVGPSDAIVFMLPNLQSGSTPTPDAGQGVEAPVKAFSQPLALQGHEPAAGILSDPSLTFSIENPGDENTFAFRAAGLLFQQYKPRALLINLPSTDEWGHETGGIIAPDIFRQIMQTTDQGLGQLMELYRQAGIFDKTLWVITADHGMIPNTHPINLGKLRAAGEALGLDAKTAKQAPYSFLPDPSKSADIAEAYASANIPGFLGAYAKVKVNGQYVYQPAPTTQAALDSVLNDAYLYLLSTFESSGSPDMVLMTKENTTAASNTPDTRGSHLWVTWGDQHIPLILSGPGVLRNVQSSAPARLVDLLPTISRLMGFSLDGMDGVVLSDALAAPQARDVAAQAQITQQLSPLRDALPR